MNADDQVHLGELMGPPGARSDLLGIRSDNAGGGLTGCREELAFLRLIYP